MEDALNYKNSRRSIHGTEDHRTRWFTDIKGLNWGEPFFRAVDGKDHTHFFLDIDIDVPFHVKKKYTKYPDRLRALKIEAGLEFFRGWQAEHSNHDFFWKISGTGLHAIQRINWRIDRWKLIPAVLFFFPPTKKVEIKISGQKNAIHVNPLPGGDYHVPLPGDRGWCLEWNPEEKKYNPQHWIRLWNHGKITYKFIIDLRFFYDDKRVVRWTYSPYWNIPGRVYYSVPVREWDAGKTLDSSVVENLEITPYDIPSFKLRKLVDCEREAVTDDDLWIKRRQVVPGRPRAEPVDLPHKINLVDVDGELPFALSKKLDKMEARLLQPVTRLAPCIKAHYLRARVDSHWSRFQVGRYLQAVNHTPTEIANFFRFKVNDEEDNSPANRHKLLQYLPAVIGPPGDHYKCASCSVMQKPYGHFFVCDEKMQAACGRRHPLARFPGVEKHLIPGVINRKHDVLTVFQRQSYWKAIKKVIREAFGRGENLVLWKATRAGVTTTMIRIAMENKKKLLVVVPTNRISEETFPEAMKITHGDLDIPVNGAILASNRKGCLLLNFVERELREMKLQSPDWGASGIAWTRLRYHSKGDCSKCAHRCSEIATPVMEKGVPVPLNESEILDNDRKTGYCAYATFRNNINRFDVVFVTYAKLYSLMLGFNEDNERLKEDLYNYFDIIMLDEVSTFANRSSIDLQLLKNRVDLRLMTDTAEMDMFSGLREEMELLADFSTTRIARYMLDMIQLFIISFEHLKLRRWEGEEAMIDIIGDDPGARTQHPLDYYHREELKNNFNKIHALLENFTKIENRILRRIEDVLLLLCEDSWIMTNTPTPTRVIDLRFVAAPKTAEVKAFIRQFSRADKGKRVFATDACMPEVNLSDFFQVDFKDHVVGDPRKTNTSQLIIGDSRKVGITRFLGGRECRDDCNFLVNEKCMLTHTFTARNPSKGWKEDDRVIRALFNDRCYHYQIQFMRELCAIAAAFGPENVMVVMPNRDAFFWLLRRITMRAIPAEMEITYYRSDKTMGVACDKRVMVCLSMPYTPRGSHLWLAYYYHRDNLFTDYTLEELDEKLRLNACKTAFWQTIGRAKAPKGDERSVVIAWGINREGIDTLFDFNAVYMEDSLPRVVIPRDRGHDDAMIHEIARIWRSHGMVADSEILQLVNLCRQERWRGKWLNHSEIKRHSTLSQISLEKMASGYSPGFWQTFGLEVKIGSWGIRRTFSARASDIDEKL